MDPSRESEIRAALARAAVERSELDPDVDAWILAAWDLLEALDDERAEIREIRSWEH